MVQRPLPRDNDAMAARLSQLVADQRRLNAQVGQLAQQAAMPAPPPAWRAQDVAGLGASLDVDHRGRLSARLSADDGNTLTTGADGGLYASGGATPGTAVFAVTGPQPDPRSPEIWYSDWTDYPDAFIKPDAEYGAPFEYQMITDQPVYWSTLHTISGVPSSVYLPGRTSSTTSTISMCRLGWSLLPWANLKALAPEYAGDWLEMEATYWFTGYPSSQRVCLMRFYPGVAVHLAASGRLEAVPNAGKGAPPYPAAVVSQAQIPLSKLVRIRLQARRYGQTIVKVYHTNRDVDEHYDDWCTLDAYKINFSDFAAPVIGGQLPAPSVTFGAMLHPQLYSPAVTASPYPAVTVPDMWMAGPTVTICKPAPVYWKTVTGGLPK